MFLVLNVLVSKIYKLITEFDYLIMPGLRSFFLNSSLFLLRI